MGSKRWMLANGLGHLLRDETSSGARFVDLFAGSGIVSSFVARKSKVEVRAYDLQVFCAALTHAIIGRTSALRPSGIWESWVSRATANLDGSSLLEKANVPLVGWAEFNARFVADTRAECEESNLPITRAYGGHYFSAQQATWIDALRATLPHKGDEKSVALAALIRACSQCVAAPGHTAQPFQPTRTAKPFLYEAWRRDVLVATKTALEVICGEHAFTKGNATVCDANDAAQDVRHGDVVFVDPPYSGVHYSRFYHVLETVAKGTCGEVTGIGRYPPRPERPRSKYSVSTESRDAVCGLLKTIAKRGGTAIVTFPNKLCSNGISGYLLEETASKYFRTIQRKTVKGRFSTLGGNGDHREARQPSAELILLLRP